MIATQKAVALRLLRWLELSRQSGAVCLLIDGSFVTAKESPNDIDAVVWLANDFERHVTQGSEAALVLKEMLLTRCPEEIVAAEDVGDWND